MQQFCLYCVNNRSVNLVSDGISLSSLSCKDRNPEIGVEAVKKLLDSVDEWLPDPTRELDKPFLMPVEGIFSIPGRGTVVTGRVERGKIKKGDTAEFVGLKSNIKTTITGQSACLTALLLTCCFPNDNIFGELCFGRRVCFFWELK